MTGDAPSSPPEVCVFLVASSILLILLTFLVLFYSLSFFLVFVFLALSFNTNHHKALLDKLVSIIFFGRQPKNITGVDQPILLLLLLV